MQLGEYNEKKAAISVLVVSFVMSHAFSKTTISEINSGWIGYRGYYGVEAPTEPKVGE